MMREFHVPVMKERILEFLNLSPLRIFVDCTLGDGGHTEWVLRHTEAFCLGMDVDKEAIGRAGERLLPKYGGRIYITKGDYRYLSSVLSKVGIPRMDGALMDLGVSSLQVDSFHRGFSYKEGTPLDMRMNMEQRLCARDILETYEENDLERIFREYGEERFSARIARAVVAHREKGGKFITADDLVAVVLRAGRWGRGSRAHPARRTFQALRIATNDELGRLGKSLKTAFNLLGKGGVLSVLTYHSLEDRIVKGTFRSFEDSGKGKRLNRKVITPKETEIAENPRARSAKLRAVQKIY